MIEFKLPSMGADMDEGKLLEWKVKPGDAVKRGQVVAVVDTSKAAVDVESWEEGTVHRLVVEPGETVPVGAVLALFLAPGESAEAAAEWTPPEVPKAREARAPAALAGSTAPPAPGRRRVSPAARRRAEELGVALDGVAGTGPDGAVTLEDIERAAREAVQPKDRTAEMRKAIAAAMSRSKREIPHYYLTEAVPLQRATTWLARQNEARPVTERLLLAVVFLKAVAVALKGFPELNGLYRDGAFEPSGPVHVGVAISLRQGGLIAPAIHHVADKSLEQLMTDLTDLVSRARAGSLRSSEMSDPTITVTNLGEQGVQTVLGVIYPPQVALVGFGRVVEQPWVIGGGTVGALPVVTASLAADHRVSDGHRGGLFLAALREVLQQPESL
jgi:pyruvate dehydrogenase E2 component (dihydrolipoamide acetyltransferase)